MNSAHPRSDAMCKAAALQREHPEARTGYHHLAVGGPATAWMAIAYLPDGRTITAVFTDGPMAPAMLASARRTGQLSVHYARGEVQDG